MPDTYNFIKSVQGISVSANADGSEAYITLTEEDLPEGFLTFEELRSTLLEGGVTFGVIEGALNELVAKPVYGQPILVARGEKPVDGEDARLEYLFDLAPSHEPSVDANGKINYKDLNYIQSAQSGQLLVKKHPPTAGTPGRSVFDEEIPPKPGRDKLLPAGFNVEPARDGMALTAAVDGTISFRGGRVSIHAEQNIPGSVDSSIGNLDCAGSLRIAKDITSDFKVQTGQDLEIGGNVEDAKLVAGASILIRGGFFGGGKGSLVAGADVTVKYVENQKIRAGGSIFVGHEVHNGDLYAADSIILKDKNGYIAGGRCAARYYVRAGRIGNEAAVPTHIYVAYDMQAVERQRQISQELEKLAENEHNVKEAMVKLYQIEMAGKLPPEQRETLDKFKKLAREIPERRKELEAEYSQLESTVEDLGDARIIADQVVFAGTTLHFGALYKTITKDIYGPVCFERLGDTITKASFTPDQDARWERQRQERRRQRQELQAQIEPEKAKPAPETELTAAAS